MTENCTEVVYCGECRRMLNESAGLKPPRPSCPYCGSVKRHIEISITESVGLEVKEFFDAKAKNTSLPSKNKLRLHIQAGDELHRKSEIWMKKERVIDKDRDHYREVIKNSNNEVIHFCEEPLSKHMSHGSAKPKEIGDKKAE